MNVSTAYANILNRKMWNITAAVNLYVITYYYINIQNALRQKYKKTLLYTGWKTSSPHTKIMTKMYVIYFKKKKKNTNSYHIIYRLNNMRINEFIKRLRILAIRYIKWK